MNGEGLELTRVIGVAATIALAEEFAGTRIYVPLKVRDSHRITRAIGREAADKLCAYYGPTAICVPLLRELRAQHYRSKGLTYPRIAVRLGLTEKSVQKLFGRLKRPSEAASLQDGGGSKGS